MRNWLLLVGVLQLTAAGLGCGDGLGDAGEDGAGGEAGDGEAGSGDPWSSSSSWSSGGPAGAGGSPAGGSSAGGGPASPGDPAGSGGSSGSSDPASGSTSSGGVQGGACAGQEDSCPFEAGVEIDCKLRFMYGVNYAWRDFGADFGGQPRWSQTGVSGKRGTVLADLQDMRAHGVDVVRWWIYPRLYGDQVTFDGQGNPTGLGGTSTQDILAALELADQAQVNVMFTLFSFDGFHKTTHNPPSGLPVWSLGPIVADSARRARLIGNVVRPVAKAVASSPHQHRMLAWDVINEPEWAMTGPSLYGDPAFEGDASKFDLVTHAQMEALAKESAAVLRQETGAPVSVGSAAIKWGQAWTRSDVDFYQVHMYGWVNEYFPYTKSLDDYGLTDKPVVMGEFPINMLDMGVTYEKFVSDLYDMGYAGALSWSITDGNFPWAPAKTTVKAFADKHACETRY